MKRLLLLSMILSLPAAAQVTIDELCGGKEPASAVPTPKSGSVKLQTIGSDKLVIMDNGFCAEYLKQREQEKVVKNVEAISKPIILNGQICEESQIQQPVTNPPVKTDPDKWKLRLYASHSFTTYFDTDMKIQSTRYNIEVKDYKWAERGSREFFTWDTMTAPGNNPAQIIDEPTNTFVVSLEKDGHEFFLSAFHPKFLQHNQVVEMSGTIDGHQVIPAQPLNTEFYGYTHTPGESKIVRNQNTHKQMIFEVGYGHRFNLLDTKFGKLTYVPAVGVGVTVGENLTVVVKEGQWWEFDESLDKHGVQGFGGSVTNRLEYTTRNQKFGVFYENKLGYYKQKHGFLDGTQEYDLKFMGNSVGMTFMLYNPKNKKKKPVSGL
jgi:hypothetical protein